MSAPPLRVVVVGGGVAGMAAALALADRGHAVQLLERRPFLGGRAYSFAEPRGGLALDNGQHAMLGCYTETLAFLRRVGAEDRLYWHGLRMEMREGRRRAPLDAGAAPAPFHLPRALLRYRFLSASEKGRAVVGAARWVARAKRSPESLAQRTVRSVLRELGQDEGVCRRLWDPLALAALNADPEVASAGLFAAVLQRAFFGRASDASIVLPAVPLQELFGEPGRRALVESGVDVLPKARVIGIAVGPECGVTGVEMVDGGRLACDAVVAALPPRALARISIGARPARDALGDWVDALGDTMPIVSTHVALDRPVSLPPMLGLIGTATQWVFHTSAFRRDAVRGRALVSCVVSAAADLDGADDRTIARRTAEDLDRLVPEMGPVAAESVHVVREKHATIAATVEATAARPPTETPVPGLYLAGDWVRTGLPATIESAAESARLAANAVEACPRARYAAAASGVAA